MIRKIIALSFILLAVSGCMGEIRSFEYSMARRYGASMKLNLHVVDDEGNAVSNAQVRCSMSMLSGDWNRDSGLTDADGRACIEGTTDGHEIRLSVAKDGYYCSERKICFGGMVKPREVRFNRWQPYGEEITVTLYPIRNPAKVVRIYKTISFPKTGERCGLDLDRGDWVAPHGKGVSADVWLCARWDVNPSRPARYIEADVGFSGDAGYYWEKPNESSSLRYPYAALIGKR